MVAVANGGLPEGAVRALAQAFIIPAMKPVGTVEDREMFVELARLESGFDPNVVGPKGEIGLWQVHPSSWQTELKRVGIINTLADLNNPITNAKAAAYIWNKQGWQAWTTNRQAMNNLVEKGVLKRLETTDPYGPEWDIDFGPIDVITNPTEHLPKIPGVGTVMAWADGLAKFLGTIVNPTFWKALGIGALGLLVVLLSFAVYNKEEVSSAAGVVARKGK